ncbi:MAG: phage tail protein [Oscillochloris sp.]|nr:phage tail protein [Oscillochloris sp.]
MPTEPAKGEDEPLLAHRVSFEFGKEVTGLLISCDGLESKNEILEARGAGLKGKELLPSRTPGKLSIDPLELQLFVLKSDKFFEDWFHKIQDGKIASERRDGAIKMYGHDGKSVVAEWKIEGAWPSKLAYSDLDSSSNDGMKLTVTLIYEGFERTA